VFAEASAAEMTGEFGGLRRMPPERGASRLATASRLTSRCLGGDRFSHGFVRSAATTLTNVRSRT